MSTKSRNAIDVLDLVISVLTEQQRELDKIVAEISRLTFILGKLTDRLEKIVEDMKEIKEKT